MCQYYYTVPMNSYSGSFSQIINNKLITRFAYRLMAPPLT